ncbi:MAG: pilin [Candidatus Peribacteraceae bacterium]
MRRFTLFLLGLLLPVTALAVQITDYDWQCTGFLRCGSSLTAVGFITENIATGVSAFIAALAVVAFFYGAILMIISQGEERKEAGKKAMIYASIGLAFAMLTVAVIEFVTSLLYDIGGTPPP